MEKPTYLLECTPFWLVQKFLIQNGETMSRGCLAQNRKSVNASLLKSSFSLQKRLGKNLLRYRKSNTKHALNITLLASNSAPLRQPPWQSTTLEICISSSHVAFASQFGAQSKPGLAPQEKNPGSPVVIASRNLTLEWRLRWVTKYGAKI